MPVFSNAVLKKFAFPLKFSPLVLTLYLGVPQPLHAALVVLANGDRIHGQVVGLDGSTLVFESPLFGEIELPWKQVQELSTDEEITVQFTDGKTLKGRLGSDAQNGGFVLTDIQGSEPVRSFRKAEVAAFNPPVVDYSVKYTGRANLGGVFNRGNSEDNALNFDTEFIARTPDARYKLAAEVNDADSAGITTTSNRYLLTQYDAFLSEKDYLFVSARAEQDKLADLNLRTSYGAGYGYQFFETERAKLSTEYGLAYVTEDYILAPDETYPSLSFALNYERKFWNKRLVFFNNNDLSVGLENAADSLLKFKTGLRVPIVENVNVATQVNVNYDNMPPPGVKKTDSSLIFSVGYGF